METSVDIQALRQRIAVANQQSSQVNNSRTMNLGRRQTLEAQINELFSTYEKKYGVKLTLETLQDEITKVALEKEQECSKLSSILEAISQGDYARANQLAGVVSQTQEVEQTAPTVPQTAPTVPQTAPTVPQTAPVVEQTAPVVEQTAPITPPPVVPQTAPVVEQTAPITPPPVVPQTAPVAPPPIIKPVTPVAPPPSVTPVTPPPVTNNQLSGVGFMQGVQEKSPSPMSALEGFTTPSHGVPLSGLPLPELDVAKSPKPVPTSFGQILGGNQFTN